LPVAISKCLGWRTHLPTVQILIIVAEWCAEITASKEAVILTGPLTQTSSTHTRNNIRTIRRPSALNHRTRAFQVYFPPHKREQLCRRAPKGSGEPAVTSEIPDPLPVTPGGHHRSRANPKRIPTPPQMPNGSMNTIWRLREMPLPPVMRSKSRTSTSMQSITSDK